MTNANGDEVGRTLYDSFGMVMENTLTAELTGALLDVPDAATGLVHLGGGRWYDPALGRPLQPNPAGGPPTVPQALNRYAATPLGQPGVAQAAASSTLNLTSLELAVDFVNNTAIELAERAAHTSLNRALGGVRYRATASIWMDMGEGYIFPPQGDDIVRWYRGTLDSRGAIWATVEAESEAALRGSLDDFVEGLARTLPDAWIVKRGFVSGSIRRIGVSAVDDAFAGLRWVKFAGFGIDFGLGFGFQALQDYNNPYLTNKQVFIRAGLNGLGEATGAWVIAKIAAATICVGSEGILCPVVAAMVGGYLGSQTVNSFVFEIFPGLKPTRELAPLLQ